MFWGNAPRELTASGNEQPVTMHVEAWLDGFVAHPHQLHSALNVMTSSSRQDRSAKPRKSCAGRMSLLFQDRCPVIGVVVGQGDRQSRRSEHHGVRVGRVYDAGPSPGSESFLTGNGTRTM